MSRSGLDKVVWPCEQIVVELREGSGVGISRFRVGQGCMAARTESLGTVYGIRGRDVMIQGWIGLYCRENR